MDTGTDVQEDELLTLQEAADRLKVHYMTAYRWVRGGELAAFKAGGRLRVRTSELERFVAERQVDVALPTGGRTVWPTHVDRLHELLRTGQGGHAAQLVRKIVADGAPAGDVYLHLLTPTLHRIGLDWERGDIGVAEEHRATAITTAIMAHLSDSFRRPGPRRGTAVTLTPPGEQHAIPAAMVADFLRGASWQVHHLGANVPVADLRSFLETVPAAAVCLSVTDAALGTQQLPAIIEAAGPALVVVGGQGADPAMLAAIGAIREDDPSALARHLDQLLEAG